VFQRKLLPPSSWYKTIHCHTPKDDDLNQGMSLPHSLVLSGLATLLTHLDIIPKIQEKEINIQGTINEILQLIFLMMSTGLLETCRELK